MKNGKKKKILVLTIKKIVKLLGQIRKEDLENLSLTGDIESKSGKRKQQVTYLSSLCEQRLGVLISGQTLLGTPKDRKLRKAMTAHVLNDMA